MSHFSVIVIGPNIEAQLQPYHEFECTGENDQYVVDIDVTDELRAEYQARSRTYYDLPVGKPFMAFGHLIQPPRERVESSDPRLFREITDAERAAAGPMGWSWTTFGGGSPRLTARDWGDGKGYRAKIFDPASAGAVAVSEVMTMTFMEFISYARGEQPVAGPGEDPDLEGDAKFGYVRVDEHGEVVAVIDRTNPNKKWDYWRIGGRWTGYFPLKINAGDGLISPRKRWDSPDPDIGTADQCTVAQLDIERAKFERQMEASARFDRWEALVKEHGRAKSWAEVRAAHDDINAARKAYQSQRLIQATKRGEHRDEFGWEPPVDEIGYDREAYIKRRVDQTLVPYAMVKGGKWYAKGTMGGFGCSHDEGDEDKWNEDFHRMLADLPPDTLLTIVDCHI